MARDRSPNYPAFDLGTTLGFVRKVYQQEGKSSAKTPVLAAAMGYSGLSGSARTRIATMRQYGLLEDAPEGKARLSSRAVHLLNLTPSDADYSKVAQEAAFAPPLFREFHQNPEASDRNLELDLITVKHFSPDGARRVIKSYRDTLAFAKLAVPGYNDTYGEADDEAVDEDATLHAADHPTDAGGAPSLPKLREASVTYTWPLDDAEKVLVTFIGNPGRKPTRRDLDALIETLESIRKRTPQLPEEGRTDAVLSEELKNW